MGFDRYGIATRRALLGSGWSEKDLTSGVKSGDVLRVRNGWYAHPSASEVDVAAVRTGGRLTASSLTKELGIWTVHDQRLHVAVPPNASRMAAVSSRVVRHWIQGPEPASPGSSRDPLANAIAIIVRTCSQPDAIVAVDSALNLGLLSPTEWQLVLASLSPTRAAIANRVDGRSQSGLESRCRLSLHNARVRHRIQVRIAGVGIVDVVVGDRLVIELDGRGFHTGAESFENDRRRDLELARRGYRVLRFSYRQVMYGWPECEEVILRLVRAGEHLWRPSSRSHYFAG